MHFRPGDLIRRSGDDLLVTQMTEGSADTPIVRTIFREDVVMLVSVDEWKLGTAMSINFLVVYTRSNTPVFFGYLYYTMINCWERIDE